MFKANAASVICQEDSGSQSQLANDVQARRTCSSGMKDSDKKKRGDDQIIINVIIPWLSPPSHRSVIAGVLRRHE
jgi:hypothetical protein